MKNNWKDLEAIHLNLTKPLMLIRAKHGVLACGYLNIDAFNSFEDVAVIVTGVENFDDMFDKKPLVHHISNQARIQYRINAQMTGREILEKFKGN